MGRIALPVNILVEKMYLVFSFICCSLGCDGVISSYRLDTERSFGETGRAFILRGSMTRVNGRVTLRCTMAPKQFGYERYLFEVSRIEIERSHKRRRVDDEIAEATPSTVDIVLSINIRQFLFLES
jgi:hypothetical protein